ncbi:MAG: hypothetical protein R2873_05010 [Caldilineaceae bacterium]|nr:hypothetical protein [Caldilineaceae bacterium]
MLPFFAVAGARSDNSPLMASLFAGLFTAIVALIYVLVVGMSIVPAIVGLLIGAAPILALQMRSGALGSDWKPVIAGVIGFILFLAAFAFPAATGWITPVLGILSMIIWPIIVGAMTAGQSVGKLLLFSILGLILGLAVAFLVALWMGQDPTAWPGLAGIMFFSVWGGTVGAAMASSK